MHSAPAQDPPPSPTRARGQKTNVASGGWPATWVVQTLVPLTPSPNAMKWVKVDRKAAGSVIRGTSCRYPFGSRSTSIQPLRSPSMRVREHSQSRLAANR